MRLTASNLLDRYLFRQVVSTFGGMLIAMMAVVLCVVALQELDVVTNQGAALMTFAVLTALSMPQMLSMMSPIALFLALLMTLNRLSADSEIVVVNASGGSPLGLLRPLMAAAFVVSFILGSFAHLVVPQAQNAWRFIISDVRADLLATVVREGTFSTLQDGLTFHMGAREPGGVLANIMIADTREYPQEIIYFADRGSVLRGENGSFLSLEDGVIQRRTLSGSGRLSTAYLYFDSYSIDLSFADGGDGPTLFKPSERTTAYLLNPDPDDVFFTHHRGRLLAELHNRLALPLYPFGYAMIIALSLATPHSARSGRGKRVLSAIGGGVVLLCGQLSSYSLLVNAPFLFPVIYLVPLLVVGLGIYALSRRIDPFEVVAQTISHLFERKARVA
ncbi:MAG: LptF/LptG family permease [Pseudomonadota bacterium]